MKLGLVEIVIPTFNQVDTICFAIDSVLKQDYEPILIHVFDDCSTDGTWELISGRYSTLGLAKIRLYRNLINIGDPIDSIMQSKVEFEGQFWGYLEGDDYLGVKDKISIQVNALNERADLAGVSSICKMENELTGESSFIHPDVPEWNYRDIVFDSEKFAFYVHTSSVLWRNFSAQFNGQLFPHSIKKVSQKSEVAVHQFILRATGLNFKHLDFIGSTYRYNGKGVWSSKSEFEQLSINLSQKIELENLVPFWYKVFYRLENNLIVKKLRPRRFNSRIRIP